MKSRIWFFLFWILLLLTFFNSDYLQIFGNEKNPTATNQSNKKTRFKTIIVEPKKMVIEKGDIFEAKIKVGYFEPIKEDQKISINGQSFRTNDEGIVEFNENTNYAKTGIRRLSIQAEPFQFGGGLTGKSFGPSCDYKYLVVNSQKIRIQGNN